MFQCKVAESDCTKTMQGLKGNETLTKLDVSGNEIGDKGAIALSKNIQFRDQLKFVSLLWNRVGPDGLAQVKRATRTKNLKKIEPKQEDIIPIKDLDLYTGNFAGSPDFGHDVYGDPPTPKPERINKPYHDSQIDGLELVEAVTVLRDVLLNEPKERVKTPNVTVLTDTLRAPDGSDRKKSDLLRGTSLRRNSSMGSSRNMAMDATATMHSKFDVKVIRAEKEKKPFPRMKDKMYLNMKVFPHACPLSFAL